MENGKVNPSLFGFDKHHTLGGYVPKAIKKADYNFKESKVARQVAENSHLSENIVTIAFVFFMFRM